MKDTDLKSIAFWREMTLNNKIKRSIDEPSGMSIATKMPGISKPTERERRVKDELLRKQHEEYEAWRKKFNEKYPPPNKQMDQLMTMILEIEENGLKNEMLQEIKKLVTKTKEDYLNHYEQC